MKALIYDIEIEKGIVGKGETRREGFEYCAGWHDHANMGVSVIGAYDYGEDRYRVFCKDNMEAFFQAVDDADVLVSFNGLAFDNQVIRACWSQTDFKPDGKCYDLLVELWAAAGLGPKFEYPSHAGFGLDAVCLANFGTRKTGHGAAAPLYWQQKMIGNVIDYCLNDVRLTKQLFDCVLSGGSVKCPKTGAYLGLRSPHPDEEAVRF